MQEMQFIQAWTMLTIARIKARQTDERGAVELTTIVITTAIIAAAAIAIAGAIVLKFTNKANTIPTE